MTSTNEHLHDHYDVAIVGAGWAGLSAALSAAHTGSRVVLLEQRSELGGRGRSTQRGVFTWNDGPRAVYHEAEKLLVALGVSLTGRSPSLRTVGTWESSTYRLTNVRDRFLNARQKVSLANLMRLVFTTDVSAARGTSFHAWVSSHTDDERLHAFVVMLARTSTYCAELDRTDAAIILTKIREGRHGVRYVDGGWASITQQLERLVVSSGITVARKAPVRTLTGDGDHWQVATDDRSMSVRSVVLAGLAPSQCASFLPSSSSIATWASTTRPITASCLDLGLSKLPVPRNLITLGLDQPMYLSFHSPFAKLVHGTGNLGHAIRYDTAATADLDHYDTRASIERFVDLAQPGWRDALVEDRYLHRMVVAHDLPPVGATLAERRPITVQDAPGVFLAGDSVGPVGLLAEASLSSGRVAGERAAHYATRNVTSDR
jgi:phytoene dehydrogenase-like protein